MQSWHVHSIAFYRTDGHWAIESCCVSNCFRNGEFNTIQYGLYSHSISVYISVNDAPCSFFKDDILNCTNNV